jgi:predicted DNA-binding transcriptional regulator YafY
LSDSLNAVGIEIENQKAKLFGSFAASKEKLVAISNQANELVAKTESRKSEIKDEIQTVQAVVTAVMEENYAMIETAPKGKEGKQAIEAITSDLSTITVSISEVPALVEQGELLNAQAKIAATQQKANEINAELKAVMAKYTK